MLGLLFMSDDPQVSDMLLGHLPDCHTLAITAINMQLDHYFDLTEDVPTTQAILELSKTANGVMAELTGRIGGYSKGKGGSMHMYSVENQFYGGNGIVGAQVPIGTGLAFAHKYKKDGGVCVAYFGDGATNQGQVYEAFNMAELWRLPVLYVIENNQYAMGTSVERSSADTHLYRRGSGFGIPGREVDGMDVMAVEAAATEALAWCREGNGPTILEMKTYRYRGHSMSDPAKYRSKEEVKQMRSEHDPIDQQRARILEQEAADEGTLKEIDKQVKAVVAEAADFAQMSPEPDPAEI
ncbi:MAG TPA: hypothetical protein EYQ81_05860, partial [Sneathiellales bacterium]|nr:hypothetical protein [Sneathiellales bacterium]